MQNMQKKKVVLSESEKQFQIQSAQEKELMPMIRQYLVLEKTCNHSYLAKDSFLEKLEKVVKTYKKEHLSLLLDLARAMAPERIRDDNKLFDELLGILDEYVSAQEKVKKYKVYLVEIEAEKKIVEKHVKSLQKEQVRIADKEFTERIIEARRTVEALENRLEAQMVKFNVICAKNKELRQQMKDLLYDRQIFMVQWQRLIDKLAEGKKIMLDLIEQASIAYNQREDLCSKLQLLRMKAFNDFNVNLQDMRDNRRKFDGLEKLREFFDTKGQKRIMRDLQVKQKIERALLEERLNEKLAKYQQMYKDIKKFTKKRNNRAMAEMFRRNEEENLSYFKYIIDTILEVEGVNDRLAFFQFDIDEKHLLHVSRLNQQNATLEQLEQKLNKSKDLAEEAERALQKSNEELQVFLDGISSLFKICHCDRDPLMKLLSDNSTVKRYNVNLYVNILERTVHTLLLSVGYKDKVRKSSDPKKLLEIPSKPPRIYKIEEIVKATPCSLCVEHEMVSDVIDTLQHVWSKSEAKSKLNVKLNLPGGALRLHTISMCALPKARTIIQRRYM